MTTMMVVAVTMFNSHGVSDDGGSDADDGGSDADDGGSDVDDCDSDADDSYPPFGPVRDPADQGCRNVQPPPPPRPLGWGNVIDKPFPRARQFWYCIGVLPGRMHAFKNLKAADDIAFFPKAMSFKSYNHTIFC
ncbi:hypothetical protein ElyMa_006653600 [Elysia marginata]|uniref:PiggyBac transposable element-derived protein domain-containing protein n=1 Tax=Elysia marginata TaxID=1093978 RepID=A0AAV4IET2_9GAST|nr:hypothetical protein ElyMa_006653600 [Elysia marginata]